MIDNWNAELVLGPVKRIGIAALARQEQGSQIGQVVVLNQFSVRILLLDRPKRRWRCEHGRDIVLRHDAPEGAGIRRSDRLAFEQNRRVAVQQRAVNDVGVADDPADVGRGPIHFARIHSVNIFHRPVQRDGMTAVVANDALWLASRPRGVEQVEGVGCRNGYAAMRLSFGDGFMPVDISSRDHAGSDLGPLKNDAMRGFVS